MPLFARAKEDAQPPTPASPQPTYLPDRPRPQESGLRSPRVHRDYLISQVESLRPFGVLLLDAAGLILCEEIIADLDLPTFTAATSAGWAVRASNLVGASEQHPVILPVVDHVDSTARRGAPLTGGTAVRVEPGAPVPEGADAVVPEQDGLAIGDDVRFVREARFQQNLVPAGSRIADGDRLLDRGVRLTPRALGLIAEIGHDKVLARPRPRVVVLAADDFLVEPGLPLTRLSQVYDACTTLLAATARDDGAQVFPAGIAPVDSKALARTLSEQLIRADLVLLVAELTDDLIDVLGDIGAIDVAEIEGLPGRHAFALLGVDRTPVLVLPPGPVPAYLTYLQFGRPLLRRLEGEEPVGPIESSAPITEELTADPDQARLLLAQRTDRGVTPLAGNDPGVVELAAADTVIVVPPGAEPVPAHADVACWHLD